MISADTQAGRGIVQFGGNCVHPSDSGKDGEVDELIRLHGTKRVCVRCAKLLRQVLENYKRDVGF